MTTLLKSNKIDKRARKIGVRVAHGGKMGVCVNSSCARLAVNFELDPLDSDKEMPESSYSRGG